MWRAAESRAGVKHNWWSWHHGHLPTALDQIQSAELLLSNGSLATKNSCLSSSHTPWARSPLPEWPFLLSCVPVPPAQVTAAPNALPDTHQIFKSLIFQGKNANYQRLPPEFCWWQESLTVCHSLAYIWWFIGKGLSLCTHQDTASLVFLGWMLFSSHLNNHLFFLSNRAFYGRMGASEGWGTAVQETQGYQSSCSAELCMGVVG